MPGFTFNWRVTVADLFKHRLSHGHYAVSEAIASKLCGGVLPKHGNEKLVAHQGDHYWVTRSPQHGSEKGWVWTIRKTDWVLENGRAILKSR